ncbi:MAG: YggT family protein [Proteobacteria bacterium]|nr:YggT family protein [Pseudomonadota bacterium]NOG60618.1 YggT family protein [Pseudomonadota bacterium]
MGGGYFTQAGVFLIEIVFGLYILAVLLRFLLARVRADFYNPLSQFIVKITNPAIKPLRRLIPGYYGIDWPSIILLLLVQAIEIILISWITRNYIPAPMGLFVLTFAYLLKEIIYVYLFIIIIQVVISWVNPGAYNPATVIMYQLSEPILKPARRLLPPAGGFDFSPLVVLILLQLSIILLVSPIMDLGLRLSV